ncbi:MAG: DUF3857 domain-containing protein [Chitinophagaceae bacterium]|nr:MAG: DUF3857 domain-containing protein [Chitinophagaceae bacterium]
MSSMLFGKKKALPIIKNKMRYLSLFICCLAIQMLSHAQDFQDFGIVSPEEKLMKECAFDPEADAVVLKHEAHGNHDERYQLVTTHHVRIKILKESGLDRANIRIPFYSNDDFEHVRLIRGITYNRSPEGAVKLYEVTKNSVFKKKINKYYSEMVFTFPEVQVGSIIEYTYESIMKSYGGLENWEFQRDIPVLRSFFSVVILPDYEFAYRVQKREDLPVKINRNTNIGRVDFEMKNIPALRDEPYMDARKDNLQMVVFQLSGMNTTYKRKYMTTWQEVIRELSMHASFGGQIGKNLSGTDEFISIVKLDPSLSGRVNKVFNFVRSNFNWNGFNSLYAGDGIKQAWSKKTGTSSEVNLILTTLLREAGIEAHPMLVSERQHGRVLADYPFIDQFNTVYVYAVADGKKYYLDATDKNTPVHIIPHSILNTTALVVNRKNGGLIQIKDEDFVYRHYTNVTGRLGDDGKIGGSVFMSSFDYARSRKLQAYQSNPAGYIKTLKGATGAINIDSFELKNTETDTLPLQQKFLFSTALNNTGEYTFLPIAFFSDFSSNPFLSDIRFSKVNFGYRQSHSMNAFLELPAGAIVDALPKPIRVSNSDKSIVFTRNILHDAKTQKIVSRITLDLNQSEFSAEDYAALKEFYKKMFDLLNEPVVIKKN